MRTTRRGEAFGQSLGTPTAEQRQAMDEFVKDAIARGEFVAITGPSGAGKTTLGYLAARLYEVGRGRVTIGSADVRDLSFQALTELVGVVSQETYLFHATIRENLRFAKPEATAEAARIHEMIAALPGGYDTVVGERGYRFSGGEKQRLGLALALAAKPDVAFLDEPTSVLTPQAKIVNGFGPIMPSFQGQVSEDQLLQIVAYIKSLSTPKTETQTAKPPVKK